MLQKMYTQITKCSMKYKLTVAIIEGTEKGYIPGQTVLLMKQTKQETIRQMAEIGVPAEYYVGIKGSHFSKDAGLDKLQDKINKMSAEYKQLYDTKPETLWMIDMDRSEKEYLRRNPKEKKKFAELKA